MNEEEKELVEGIKQYPTHRELCLIHVIERLDEELDKKNKVINLMAGDLFLKDDLGEYDEDCIEDIKKYFYKKVEEENE